MADKKEKKTFNTRVYECCGDDKLRPVMQCVHFSNGFAYATDGFMSVKQTLTLQSILSPEFLDGHSLHRDSYKSIMGFEIAEANPDGVECWNENGQTAFYEYFQYPEGEIMPDVERTIKYKRGLINLGFIGIDPEKLLKVNRALYVPNDHTLRLQFTGVDSAILIDVPGVDDQAAVLMASIINGTLF